MYSGIVQWGIQTIRLRGEWWGHPDPEIMGAGTIGPQFGLKIREGRQPPPPPGPSPGSASVVV